MRVINAHAAENCERLHKVLVIFGEILWSENRTNLLISKLTNNSIRFLIDPWAI